MKKNEDAMREFENLSSNTVAFNKIATVFEGDKSPISLKRSEMWDYFKRHNINEFIVRFEKGLEKRRLKELEDYGYHVVAKPAYVTEVTSKSTDVSYYVSKKEMKYLDLDLKVKSYFKRGWKG